MNTVNVSQESVRNETYISLVGNLNIFFFSKVQFNANGYKMFQKEVVAA